MAKNLRHVEGIIIRWGQREDSQLRPSKSRAAPKSVLPKKRRPTKAAGAAVKSKVDGLAKKKPQVMVKVTGGGRSATTIRAHMKYITKHGSVELENEQGERFNSREAIEEEVDAWATSGYGIRRTEKHAEELQPHEKLPPREAVNLLLSMPKGTDPEKLHEAAREFAREHFGGKHKYVFGLHTDRGHPHVHIAIKSRSDVDHKRLKVNKPKLQAWRESFAAHLYQQGIEAAATPRAVRNAKSYQRTFRSKDRRPGYDIERAYGARTSTPNMTRIAKRERAQLHRDVDALAASSSADDRRTAAEFIQAGDTPYFNVKEYQHGRRRRQLARADLHQSHIGKPAGVRAAQALSSVRDVPGRDVAPSR